MEVLNNVKVSVNLNLREPKKMQGTTTLYVVVKCGNECTKIPTNIKLFAYQWNKRMQQVNINANMSDKERKHNILINAHIFELKAKYMEIISYICSDEVLMSEKQIFDFIKNEYKQLTRNEDMANPNPTPNKRKATASKLLKKAFERKYGTKKKSLCAKGTFENVESKFKMFINWLGNNKSNIYDSVSYLKQSTLNAYKMYLEDCARKDGKGNINVIASKVNLIANLINEVRGWTECERYNIQVMDKIKQKSTRNNEQVKRIALSDEIIKKVMRNNNLTKIELFYRDLFEMQLESGVRFSDLKKLFTNEYKVEEKEGLKCLILQTQKEGITAVVIVTKKLNTYKTNIILYFPMPLMKTNITSI